MAEVADRQLRTFSDDAPEPVVLRNLPVNRYGKSGCAGSFQDLRVEPSPEDDAVGQRIAGSHAGAERALMEMWRSLAAEGRQGAERDGGRGVAAESKEIAPVQI